MQSPTTALLWEIWRQHRWAIGSIAALTVVGRSLDALPTTGPVADELSAVTTLCGMFAFLLLFAVFNYTDSGDGRGIGRFPDRLFRLPVSSLRLVSIPVMTGIVAIEVLYLAWADPFSTGGSTSPLFVATLLAALMVFYLAVLWTCARAGSMRLVIIGAIAAALFAAGLLPTFPPTPPPAWRSHVFVAAFVGALALLAFVLTWRYVGLVRSGGGSGRLRFASLIASIADAQPARRKSFRTPAGAHFWFEWRASGTVLPMLVGGIVFFVIAPTSWMTIGDARYTPWLLVGALLTPIVLAIPIGVAFSKPTFWSDDLAVPEFVAVRPLSAQDLVAIKVKVAWASAILSWLIVLVFLAVWLPAWANLDLVRPVATRLFEGYSTSAMLGMTVLVPVAGLFLTWRSLVSHLWSGLSGKRLLFMVTVVSVVALVSATVLDTGRWAYWLLRDPARVAIAVWVIAAAVIAKSAMAIYVWRGVSRRYVRDYVLVWFAGTASLVTLSIAVWNPLRVSAPFDVAHLRTLILLVALLAVPLARVGLAHLLLARNRHR